MSYKLLVTLLAFTSLSSLSGVSSQTSATSLDSCWAWAEGNYPEVQRYGLVEKTEAYTMQDIRLAWLPQLQFTAQATYQSDAVGWPDALKTRLEQLSGTSFQGIAKDQYKLQLDLQQKLWDGNETKYAKAVAQQQTKADRAQTDVDLYQLRQRVADLYFGVLMLEKREQLNRERQQLLQKNLEKAEALVRGGVALQSDADQIRVELLDAEQQEVELQNAEQTSRAMLSLLCGRKITSLTSPSGGTSLSSPAGSDRPELSLIGEQQRLLQLKQRQLNATVLPHFNLFAQGYYGYPGLNMFENMMNRDWSWNAIVGVRMNWNIAGFYTLRNRKALLTNQSDILGNQRENFLFNQNLQSQQLVGEQQKYRDLLRKDQEIVRLRTSVREAKEKQLEHGTLDATGLLEAVTKENTAKLQQSIHELQSQQNSVNQSIVK